MNKRAARVKNYLKNKKKQNKKKFGSMVKRNKKKMSEWVTLDIDISVLQKFIKQNITNGLPPNYSFKYDVLPKLDKMDIDDVINMNKNNQNNNNNNNNNNNPSIVYKNNQHPHNIHSNANRYVFV